MEEKIIEYKVCKHCGSSFEITDKDLEFYEKVSPSFGGKKYLIPSPTLCPDCRQQRRLSFRNERKLYKRKCDATGKDIISMYSPSKQYKIYGNDFWWSDNWNPLDYGKDFDFSKSFFEQFDDLMKKVPQVSLSVLDMENSEYNNQCGFLKNCYLNYNSNFSESCFYGKHINYSKDCLDCLMIEYLENSYQCIDCKNSQSLFFCMNTTNSNNSLFLKSCSNMSYCYGCSNKSGGKYMIFNKQYSEEEYFEKLKFLQKIDIKEQLNKTKEFFLSNLVKQFNNISTENSYGDYIKNSNNIYYSYDIDNSENIKYSNDIFNSNDSYDISCFGMNLNMSLESTTTGHDSNNILFSNDVWGNTSNIIYSTSCVINCSNLFGCVGLRNKQYCILNKQYTKEEYETIVPKIIEHMMKTGEWGEFFPSSISPFGYNETVAMEYFPIPHPNPLLKEREEKNPPSTSGEGVRGGGLFNRSTYEPPFPKVEKIIKASTLPEDISKIPDDILNWAVECEITKKPFKIIKQELEFYRKHNLPIPRRHPDQRHLDRMSLRNPRKLFARICDKCGKEIKTTYSPDRKEIVYCEECYNNELF